MLDIFYLILDLLTGDLTLFILSILLLLIFNKGFKMCLSFCMLIRGYEDCLIGVISNKDSIGSF